MATTKVASRFQTNLGPQSSWQSVEWGSWHDPDDQDGLRWLLGHSHLIGARCEPNWRRQAASIATCASFGLANERLALEGAKWSAAG